MARHHREPNRDLVAITLAVGVVLALNVITAAVLVDALVSEGPGLSENATQLLTGAFGGIIGVIGGYLGYRAGRADKYAGQPNDLDTSGHMDNDELDK